MDLNFDFTVTKKFSGQWPVAMENTLEMTRGPNASLFPQGTSFPLPSLKLQDWFTLGKFCW